MLDQLQHPAREFDGLIQRHFLLMRPVIIAQCTSWLEQARSQLAADASYDGLIQMHNMTLAKKFSANPSAYYDALAEAVTELFSALGKLDAGLLHVSMAENEDDDEDDDGDDGGEA